MTHKVDIDNGIILVSLDGDLIGENDGAGIMEKVADFINKGHVKGAADLSNVRYMNSSGIGVLITMMTKLRNKGGELVLIKPSEQVKKLLTITKLNAIFQTAENRDEAYRLLNDQNS